MSIKQRRQGHAFERSIRKWCIKLGWKNCKTSRAESRTRDDECVDLMFTEPLNIQCKYTQAINLHTELSKMPDEQNYNVVFHKRKNKGVVVAMSLEDFEEIVHSLKENGIW